jgi:hypothetical protein
MRPPWGRGARDRPHNCVEAPRTSAAAPCQQAPRLRQGLGGVPGRPRPETLDNGRAGAAPLGLASVVVVFGQRQGGAASADDTQVQADLARGREGLVEVGAEEVCGLTFGGGYLLFVRPQAEVTSGSGRDEQGRMSRFDRFPQFLERLRELACRVSGASQGGPAAGANLPHSR